MGRKPLDTGGLPVNIPQKTVHQRIKPVRRSNIQGRYEHERWNLRKMQDIFFISDHAVNRSLIKYSLLLRKRKKKKRKKGGEVGGGRWGGA